MHPAREPVLSLPCPADQVPLATHVRGTALSTSFGLAREFGYEARYFELLPREHHEAIRHIEPLSWVPMPLTLEHYRVMEQLFPGSDAQVRNGHLSSERTQNAYLKTVFRAMQATTSITPLSALRRLDAVVGRLVRGGGAASAYSEGPKDARIELFGYPLLDSAYVRHGWQGMFESGLSLTARRVFVRLDRAFRGGGRAAYTVSWV